MYFLEYSIIITMPVRDINDEDFTRFVAESETWTEILRKCGYNNHGNKTVVMKRIKEMGLDASHLPTGHNWAAGKSGYNVKYSLEDILVENSTYASSGGLKRRLMKELKWEHRCNSCKNTEWMGKPIPLELEHRNGVHDDNRVENLELLCPNCHAQTDTYKGKNIKTYKEVQQVVSGCVDCGAVVTTYAKRCESCNRVSSRTVQRPSYEQLKQEIESSSFCGVAKKYGVVDNTIRKWLRYYEKHQNTGNGHGGLRSPATES
jgi:Zn finger protein HypA/HybF involved in hydrogenase expression